MSSSTNTINPKPCNYGCDTRIYWNTLENAYFEGFVKKKHVCPNRVNKSSGTTPTIGTDRITSPSNSAKPHYYNPYARNLFRSSTTTKTKDVKLI